jgi:hypothetical protein
MLAIFGDPAVIFEEGFQEWRYTSYRRAKFKSHETATIPTRTTHLAAQ